jgi:transcriptional regulator with PAS, ATPase and Fis domain
MPSSGNTKLSALKISHPEAWLRAVRLAMRRNQGDVMAAACELGVSRRTLYGWIEEHPEIRDYPKTRRTA